MLIAEDYLGNGKNRTKNACSTLRNNNEEIRNFTYFFWFDSRGNWLKLMLFRSEFDLD